MGMKAGHAELKKYVAEALKHGKKLDEIEKELLKAGWKKSIVLEAVGKQKKTSPFQSASPLKSIKKIVQAIRSRALEPSMPAGKPEKYEGTVIRLENVKKAFGNNIVLDGINLEVKQGDLYGIIGLRGSGKTTLLNTLIGFFEPEGGSVLFRTGRHDELTPIAAKIKEARQHIGFATQYPSFYPKLTVEENLDLYGILYKIPKDARAKRITELVHLMELDESRKRLAQNLSGGMQRRLGIACSLIHNPSVLILDEPTADLDPVLSKEMWQLMRRINSAGTTIILASHFLHDMEESCTKVAILHNGRIAEAGTPAELKEAYSKNDEIHLETASGNYAHIAEMLKKGNASISRITHAGHKMVIYTPAAEATLYKLVNILKDAKESIRDIDVNRPSLNEIFETLVKQ